MRCAILFATLLVSLAASPAHADSVWCVGESTKVMPGDAASASNLSWEAKGAGRIRICAASTCLTDNVSDAFPGVHRLEVHQDIALANATSEQVLIMDAAPRSRGVEDLIRIADWSLKAAASRAKA